jgi:hypothetical protein
MTEEYDPDTDYNGSRGHALADEAMRKDKLNPKPSSHTLEVKSLKEEDYELASLPSPAFEDKYFGYDGNDPFGDIGRDLVDEAFELAKIDGIPFFKWINIHRGYYQRRQDDAKLAYQR